MGLRQIIRDLKAQRLAKKYYKQFPHDGNDYAKSAEYDCYASSLAEYPVRFDNHGGSESRRGRWLRRDGELTPDASEDSLMLALIDQIAPGKVLNDSIEDVLAKNYMYWREHFERTHKSFSSKSV